LSHDRPAVERRTDAACNDPLTRWRPGSAAMVMLAVLSLSYLLGYFDRMLMVVMGEMVKGEFLLSDKQLSLLTGASFVIMYGILGIGAGWLVDRHNRKRILVFSLALWSSTTMVCGFAQSFVQLAIARGGVGIGEAALVPLAMSMLGDLYPPSKRPMATAIFYAGGMAGMLATFLIGSRLAVHYGWRVAFFAAGPPGLALALLIALFAREPARERPATSGTSTARDGRSFHLVATDRPLVLLLSAGAVSSFANIGMMQWLPMFFIRSHRLSVSDIGLLFGPALAGGMTVGMLMGGWLGNRIAARSIGAMVRFCAWVLLAIIPMYLAMLRVPSLPAALVLMFLTMVLCAIYTPVSTAAWQTICDPRARGTAGGIAGFSSQLIGGAICPFAMGALSDLWFPFFGAESLRYALMVGMVFCLLGAAMFGRSANLIERAHEKKL
jgi:MFS family permease